MLQTSVPNSFDIFEEAIAALCVEFADELGITVETYQDCIETISVQALPIARNPLSNDENLEGREYAEYFDVPVHFENTGSSNIRVRVNNGLMAVVNAAELFVHQLVKTSDEAVVTRNVFILSQYILSTLRNSEYSIIRRDKETGSLTMHTATIDYNATIKLPLEFDMSVDDENLRKSDAAAAFCIEFSLIMNVDAAKLHECIDGVVNLSQKVNFQASIEGTNNEFQEN